MMAKGRFKPCLRCGKEFWCRPCFDVGTRHHEHKYCSTVCSRAARRYSDDDVARALWAKVDKSAGPTACWPWTRSKRWDGYGRVNVHARQTMSHRVAWEVTHGPIPAGLTVLHTCDNPPCCNPAHLRLGTHAENMADCSNKGRASKPGAKLTPEQVREIKALKGKVKNAVPLTRKYGVGNGAICAIWRGDTWKHV